MWSQCSSRCFNIEVRNCFLAAHLICWQSFCVASLRCPWVVQVNRPLLTLNPVFGHGCQESIGDRERAAHVGTRGKRGRSRSRKRHQQAGQKQHQEQVRLPGGCLVAHLPTSTQILFLRQPS